MEKNSHHRNQGKEHRLLPTYPNKLSLEIIHNIDRPPLINRIYKESNKSLTSLWKNAFIKRENQKLIFLGIKDKTAFKDQIVITDLNPHFPNQWVSSNSQDLNRVVLLDLFQLVDQYQQDQHKNVHRQQWREKVVNKYYQVDTNFQVDNDNLNFWQFLRVTQIWEE